MKNFLRNIKRWLDSRSFYVIADATDNSVTLSRSLFRHMGGMDLEQAKVFAFRVPSGKDSWVYAFTVNPEFEEPTQLADIQYNSKYRSVGFECLNPSVNRIFYDYGLPPLTRVKLAVAVRTAGNVTYYAILPPSGATKKSKA